MRKLLLTTTALFAAGAISSAVVADVSITGSYKFEYQNNDSGITTAGASGDRMYHDQSITMKFENKTDSGLTIGMHSTLTSEGDAASGDMTADEHALKISGGFGTLILGADDGIGDQLTRTAHDIGVSSAHLHGDIAAMYSSTGNLATRDADLASDVNDEAAVTYILPKFGGLTVGVTIADGGDAATENDDETVFAAKYDFDAGEIKGSLHYGQMSKDATTSTGVALDASSMAIDITMGDIRAVYAVGETDVTAAIQTEVTDFGVAYNLGNGVELSAIQTEVKENTGGETLDITSIAARYTIASGLTASITYHDYDYAIGDSSETADDGSATIFGINASF